MDLLEAKKTVKNLIVAIAVAIGHAEAIKFLETLIMILQKERSE